MRMMNMGDLMDGALHWERVAEQEQGGIRLYFSKSLENLPCTIKSLAKLIELHAWSSEAAGRPLEFCMEHSFGYTRVTEEIGLAVG